MKESIVRIESKENDSFGTGFVIDSDENGVYVLTCQHVVDEVVEPIINGLKGKIVSKISFVDMAVVYIEGVHVSPLVLQLESCDNREVVVIGFSHFKRDATQKKHIEALLYKNSIELHSTENNFFYNVHKIKSKDGFSFDKGNSGSPVICKSSSKVIAMISNKEGSSIAYAIDIVNLEKVWNKPNFKLLDRVNEVVVDSSLAKDMVSFFIIFSLIFGIVYLMT